MPVINNQGSITISTSNRIKNVGEIILPERPIHSSYYSTIYKAQLERNKHFPNHEDRVHFQESNKQLYNDLTQNLEFRVNMEKFYPGITNAVSPNKKGQFPKIPPTKLGLTWHHNSYEAGVMELIPRNHHQSQGIVQSNLHPNRKGGMEIWGGGRKK